MAKSRPPREPVRAEAKLADALGPRVSELASRLPPAVPNPTTPAPARRPMTSAQLMQLAFELVGREGELELDWDRIEVIEGSPTAHSSEADASAAPDPPTLGCREAQNPATTTPSADGDHRAEALRQHTWSGAHWRDEGTVHQSPSPLDASTIERRLRRAGAVPRLRLRGLDYRRALAQLDDFVILARHADLRVIRVVTGKGLGSRGSPVLRPMVARWLATHSDRSVSGWRYETDVDGEWGSVLIVLRPRSR